MSVRCNYFLYKCRSIIAIYVFLLGFIPLIIELVSIRENIIQFNNYQEINTIPIIEESIIYNTSYYHLIDIKYGFNIYDKIYFTNKYEIVICNLNDICTYPNKIYTVYYDTDNPNNIMYSKIDKTNYGFWNLWSIVYMFGMLWGSCFMLLNLCQIKCEKRRGADDIINEQYGTIKTLSNTINKIQSSGLGGEVYELSKRHYESLI
ncbi:MAG: hypothetical protein Edafosvirus4_9 [Edafosvirus sp.]|uniref:Uncharacterized protein n=1 Tax=Edafosvirus sp. TaxID=2487765 RepID=A0A3G4ZT16_9VIRU|nr:MAG: hypothetical protein Edafosvirus4_9 [Edafosvirus sp.]